MLNGFPSIMLNIYQDFTIPVSSILPSFLILKYFKTVPDLRKYYLGTLKYISTISIDFLNEGLRNHTA